MLTINLDSGTRKCIQHPQELPCLVKELTWSRVVLITPLFVQERNFFVLEKIHMVNPDLLRTVCLIFTTFPLISNNFSEIQSVSLINPKFPEMP